jgi:nitrogen fixation protein NifQ
MQPPPLRRDFDDRRARRADEVDDVSALLMAHADPAAGSAQDAARVAEVVAVACLGDNHLWQDLQFQNRGELNALLRYWFPALVAKNIGDMKWKKFFYRQLCLKAEILICKSPSCEICSDFALCFETPEEAHEPVGSTPTELHPGAAALERIPVQSLAMHH